MLEEDNKITEEAYYRALEKRHGKEFQKKLRQSKVAICGLGGLGSNIAIALARAGIGYLHLIDYDAVDLTNIHRQQYNLSQIGMKKTTALKENLLKINPFITITVDPVMLNEHNVEEILKKDEIICEAFDRAEAKAMLVNQVLEKFPNKYMIAASGMAGMFDANDVKTKKITSYFYICGDFVSDVNDDIGLVSSRVMVCASHQAHKVLQIIEKKEGKEYEYK